MKIGMKVVVNSLGVTIANKDKATSKTEPKRPLLRDVSFAVEPGDVVALMGPSGAGKTTMLNRLVGRGIAGDVTGSISFDGRPLAQARSGIGYVTQDDIMHETLKPREILYFAAAFQQGSRTPAERAEAVDATLQKLRLFKCADTVVGTPGLIKGISGGERKRTNVAISLLNKPRLLLLDEPTSGLDAKMAEELMADVGEVAKQGCTVMATIHQPSDMVFSHFSKLLLMESGRVAFFGPIEGLCDKLASLGFDLAGPGGLHVPLPELLLDILQVPTGTTEAEQHGQRLVALRSMSLAPNPAPSESPQSAQIGDGGDGAEFPKADRLGFCRALAVLLRRDFLNFRRNKVLTVVRTAQTVIATLVSAWIFNSVGSNLAGVKARQFGVFLLAFPMLLFPMLGVVNTFPAERAVFFREAQDQWYNPAAFFLAKVMIDTLVQCFFPILATAIGYPILGLNMQSFDRVLIFYLSCALLSNVGSAMGFAVSAGVSSVNTAVSITPGLVMPQLILCGLFMQIDLLPEPWQALSYLVVVRYVLQGLITNEFMCETSTQCTPGGFRLVSGDACSASPCDFCCEAHEVKVSGGICPVLTCEEALNSLGLDAEAVWPSGDSLGQTVAYNLLVTAILLLVFRLLGMVVLTLSYRRAARKG